MPGGQPGGGVCRAQLRLTDALIEIFVRQKTQREQPETFLLQQITHVTWKTCILVQLNARKVQLSWLACGCHRFCSLFFTLAQFVISSLFSFYGSFSSLLLTVFFSQHRIFNTFSQKDVLLTVFGFLNVFLTFLFLFCVKKSNRCLQENHGHFLKFCC